MDEAAARVINPRYYQNKHSTRGFINTQRAAGEGSQTEHSLVNHVTPRFSPRVTPIHTSLCPSPRACVCSSLTSLISRLSKNKTLLAFFHLHRANFTAD